VGASTNDAAPCDGGDGRLQRAQQPHGPFSGGFFGPGAFAPGPFERSMHPPGLRWAGLADSAPASAAAMSGAVGSTTACSTRPCFQGGQRRPGDFGRERREFAGGLRPDRTPPRSSCLARCSSCGAPPLRVTSG